MSTFVPCATNWRRPFSLPPHRKIWEEPRQEVRKQPNYFSASLEVRSIAWVEITLDRETLGQDDGVASRLDVISR